MRKRVKVKWNPQLGVHVDLPTYATVPGSFLPVTPNFCHANGLVPTFDPADPRFAAVTVEIDCPDDYAAVPGGPIDARLIREKYRNHPRWADPNRPPDV